LIQVEVLRSLVITNTTQKALSVILAAAAITACLFARRFGTAVAIAHLVENKHGRCQKQLASSIRNLSSFLERQVRRLMSPSNVFG
jgi:hypothetical protein